MIMGIVLRWTLTITTRDTEIVSLRVKIDELNREVKTAETKSENCKDEEKQINYLLKRIKELADENESLKKEKQKSGSTDNSNINESRCKSDLNECNSKNAKKIKELNDSRESIKAASIKDYAD